MNAQPGLWSRWPKWVQGVFIIFGFLFVFVAVRYIAGQIAGPYSFSGHTVLELSNLIIAAEFLLMLLAFRLIVLTLRQPRTVWTIALSIFYGLAAILIVILFEVIITVSITIPLTGGGGGQVDPTIYIAGITGLITAIAGLYGQIISARKLSWEMEQEQLNSKGKQAARSPRKPARKPARK
jgi:hypothetical protein